ncbi:MAG: 23S rRNA (uracil(1939)-C(5))-methyltransferase RlmD [Solirubrobacterales bacterium]
MASGANTSNRPARGTQLDLTIESLAYGGRGIARHDGLVVFVTGALPGDRVRAEVTKSKRSFCEANVTELLDPSPERVPFDGTPDPGAPWAELAYERQMEVKQEQTAEALKRIGGLEGFELEPIEPAESRWRYRNKFEYSFGTDDDGQLVLGFHARGRWDTVVDVDDTPLASERGNEIRNEVRAWAREIGLDAYDKRGRFGVLRNLIVREGMRTGEFQTRLVMSPAEIPEPPVDLVTTVQGDSGSTEGPTIVRGNEYLHEELCGLRLRIAPEAFFQTNTEMAERLYGIAADFAGLTGSELVYDLFCGIGTLGLTMASRARHVWGLEIVPEAVEDAEHNARANNLTNTRFVAGNVRTALRPLIEQAGKPDVVVLDPPRAGLSAKMIRRVIECEAKRIVYVSCNPTTLAPNAAQLVEAGYALRTVRPVDMFPQTPHIECVALLERA